MNLSGIISISGKPGLSKIITQSKNGIIVESLLDGKRFPVQGTQRVSSLEDISIYTMEEDVLLSEVFAKIYEKEKGKACLSHKSDAKDLKAYVREVLPNYDEDRVYNSDLKKLVQWYNLLLEKGLLKPEKKEEEKKEKAKASTKSKSDNKTKAKPKSEPKAKAKKTSPAAKPKPTAPRKSK